MASRATPTTAGKRSTGRPMMLRYGETELGSRIDLPAGTARHAGIRSDLRQRDRSPTIRLRLI